MRKGAVFITAAAILAAITISACNPRGDAGADNPGTPAAAAEDYLEPEVSFDDVDYNALAGAITAAYSGVLEDSDGNKAGTAYFAMGENDMIIAAYVDGDTRIGSISQGFDIADGMLLLTDVRDGEKLALTLMPMQDEDVYYIGFAEPEVSGFMMPYSADGVIRALQ